MLSVTANQNSAGVPHSPPTAGKDRLEIIGFQALLVIAHHLQRRAPLRPLIAEADSAHCDQEPKQKNETTHANQYRTRQRRGTMSFICR